METATTALHRILRLARGSHPTLVRIRALAELTLKATAGQDLGAPLNERLCSTCVIVKPLDEFEKDPGGPLGRSYRCRECKRFMDNTRNRRGRR